MRTVSVALEADVAAYLAGIDEADHATKKLDHDVEALGHDLDKLPAESAVAAAGLAGLDEAAKKTGNDVDGLAKKIEETGKKTSVSADESGKLKARIEELKGSVSKLGAEFDRTGDPALLKRFRADSSELAGLTRMFERLPDDAKRLISPLEKITQDAGKFSAEAEKAGMSLGDLGSPAMIGGIAALVPPALALAGALTTVAAAGGIAGAGIAGAVAGDPKAFAAEWGSAIGEVKKDWIGASQPFVGPTLDAIRSIGPTVDSWHIDTMFAKAATFVGPLVHGVEGFATGVEKGVAALVDKAGPEIAVLEADLPKIGDSIGTALKLISDNAEGGAQSLHDFDVALEKIIITTGALISGSEALGGALTHTNADVKHFLDDIPAWVGAIDPLLNLPKFLADTFTPEPLNTSAGGWGKAFNDLGNIGGAALTTIQDDAAGAAKMLDRMNQSFDKSLSDALGLSRADIQVAQGFADLTKQFEKGSGALNINTQRGRDNVTVIDQIVAGLQEQRDKSIAAAGGTQAATDAANKAYDSQLAHLGEMLVKLGNAKAAVDNLLNAFRDKTFTITQKVVTVYEKIGTVSQQGVIAGPVPRTPGSAYAEGGDPQPGWALVGEKGPELVHFQGGEHVYTAAQSRSMMAPGAAPWSAAPAAVQVSFEVSPAANMTWLGAIVNEGIRNGYVVVKASQVRPNS